LPVVQLFLECILLAMLTSAINNKLSETDSNWKARLDLKFNNRDGISYLAFKKHFGPLQIQRPFYPDNSGACHVYLLHPPGGVVAGDELAINISLDEKTEVLVTTPAATKFYRSNGKQALATQSFKVAKNAYLEWLPQETIFFNSAYVDMVTRVELEADAQFIGWEILCFGRPASNEIFNTGYIRQSIEIWRDDIPLCIERNNIDGTNTIMNAKWGLQQYTVSATFIIVLNNADCMEQLQQQQNKNQSQQNFLISTTQLSDVIICRYLGHSAQQAKSEFIQLWDIVKPYISNKILKVPRIWNT